jgi:pimeloyl-ACP methyl ester carboxylesterase
MKSPSSDGKTRLRAAIGLLLSALTLSCGLLHAAESPPAGTVWSLPAEAELADGSIREYEEGLIFVPRDRTAPRGATIGVRFLRFESTAEEPGPPIFYLPGGPGSTIDIDELSEPRIGATIDLYTRAGDLVMLDQRGNANARFNPDLRVHVAEMPLDEPADLVRRRSAVRAGVREALDQWQDRGVDLSTYDIAHAVADLDAARRALGYERIILRGNSFGSQWSFSYLRQHPDRVARAVLGGVEPIDFAYDRPSHVWNAMRRMSELAARDPDLSEHLSEHSLEAMIRNVLARLEDDPVEVTVTDPRTGQPTPILVGAQDVRASLMRFAPDYYMRSGLKRWPKFIIELFEGDYRYLGLLRLQARKRQSMPLIFLTIDNSIGISDARRQRIAEDPAREIIGPINSVYEWTRDLMPVEVMPAGFREDFEIDQPVLMIQGDLDMNTPIENAQHVAPLMPSGHLLRVEGGSHLAIHEAMQHAPEVRRGLLDFLRHGELDSMPSRIALEAPDFEPPGAGGSLYRQALEANGR